MDKYIKFTFKSTRAQKFWVLYVWLYTWMSIYTYCIILHDIYIYSYTSVNYKDFKNILVPSQNIKLSVVARGHFKPTYVLIFMLISWFAWNGKEARSDWILEPEET